MPLSIDEAYGITRQFARDYPGALDLSFQYADTVDDLYGNLASMVHKGVKGGYVAKVHAHEGRRYQGSVVVALENITDADDLLLTLRHEVLGHFGFNTFTPEHRVALLGGLIAAREQPGLSLMWEEVDALYAKRSLAVRAEEVYAMFCEGVSPQQHVQSQSSNQAQPQVGVVGEAGRKAFEQTCLSGARLMTIYDLQDIALMVSQGLRERTLAQQSLGAMTPMLRKQKGTEPAEPKKPFHEVVAQNLIEQLEAGTAPWQKPWTAAQGQGFMPVNASTGKRYRGINAMHLLAQDRADPRWLTYKQAADLGAQVRRGERGTMVQYWKFEDSRTKDDQGEWGTAGQPVANTPGKQDEDHERRNAPRVFYATVFNAAQIDGLPELQSTPTGDKHWDSLGRAEEIIRATGAVITHQLGDRAFYRPSTDEIVLPERGQFANPGKYYGTALHELGHWTGHESRLARDLQHPFGSEGYAREELRAEIASLILCNELGIEHDPSQHASYVANWVKVLKQDPSEIFRAASAAEKIHGFIMAMAPEVQETKDEQKVVSAVIEGLPGAVAGGSPESATEGAQSVADAPVLQTVKAQVVEQIPVGEAARRAVPAQDRQQEALQVLQRAMLLANVPPEIAKATLEHAGEQLRGGQTQGVAEPRRPHTNLHLVQTTDQAAPKLSVGNPSL